MNQGEETVRATSACPLTTERDWIDDEFGRVCPIDRSRFCDCNVCSLLPIIRSLPTASKERVELATRVLTGEGTGDTVRIAAALAGIYQPEPQWEYGISGSAK